jgi:hypothetical protein
MTTKTHTALKSNFKLLFLCKISKRDLLPILKLHNKNIDRSLWDEVIRTSTHPLVYAESWFLDAVSPDWHALILNNYQVVMPVPKKSILGIPYVVQPLFCQQLGIFSKQEITHDLIVLFQNEFSKNLSIRYSSYLPFFNENCVKIRANYILQLNKPIEEIQKLYSFNCKKNIKKARNKGISIEKIPLNTFNAFFGKNRPAAISETDIRCAELLLSAGKINNSIVLLGAFKGDFLVSSAAYITAKNTFYQILACSNSEGKKASATFLLVHSLISENANTNTRLDFEGSETPGIAYFFQGFGAENQPYFSITKHRIPFLSTLLKLMNKFR